MLWHVRIPLRQKLLLIGIFSVTIVVMITAIVRVAIVNSIDENADISWLYFWSNIEMATCMWPPTLSIIITSYSFFFKKKLYIWNLLELANGGLNIAIIIACIASFRQLFITGQNQHEYRQGQSASSTTHRNLLYYFRSLIGKSTSKLSDSYIERASPPTSKFQSSWEMLDDKTQLAPLEGIQVSRDISVSSTNLT